VSEAPPRYTLRPSQRLLGPDVAAVLKSGRSRSAGEFKLQFRPNAEGIARLAQIVPKRLAARSVDRNRVRRLVRESFRHRQARWTGYDCVVRLRVAFRREQRLAEALDALFDPGP
jgi:ribonuclease P protein component